MSLLKRIGRHLAAIGAIASTACAGAPAAQPKVASPAMWKVADADTTIYLFGTIHLLPPGTQWRSPAFDQAAKGAQALVIETIIDEQHPEAMFAEFHRLAASDKLPPLVGRVPPEMREKLTAAVASTGLPAQAFDRMETWGAGYMLLLFKLKELGLDGASGVEASLKKQFVEGGKPIGELETNAEQLGFFDGLSEAAQRKFLEGVLEDPTAMKAQFDGMQHAWTRGDVSEIAATFNSDLGDEPELKEALLARRNANWARWVKGRLKQPGTVLVAVGAGHLAGDQSVLTLLEKQGVKVTRVQ